ncbi:MAG: polysaccharide lyase family 7 protein [Flavobacterium sp.]|nr:polysaccharide lyase family 7 protein [Flavobacterium sp.]
MKKLANKFGKSRAKIRYLIFGTFLLFLSMFINSCSSDSIIEEPNSSINEEDDAANLNSRISDYDFNIFSVINSNVERRNFNTISRWYSEGTSTQIFKLYTGDHFNGDRSDHARTEAGQGLKWTKTGTTHSFEATYNVTTDSQEKLTIAQIFAGCCGPQLMIHIRKDGKIDYGSRGNGSQVIDNGNWKGRNFKIKLTMKNDIMTFYFNGVKKFEGRADERNNSAAQYHFRWGVYSNNDVRSDGKMDKNVQVKVTGLSRS